MSVSLEALGITKMSIEDQIELVHAIWDNIAANSPPRPIGEALRAELDRRLEDHLANPDDVVPWDEVRAAALTRIKR